VALGADEGLPRPSVVNADVLITFDRVLLTDRAGALDAAKVRALDDALRYALDL
jgi:mRNA-degrading endonuclease toxin of MazEF toxin-antitoxin module